MLLPQKLLTDRLEEGMVRKMERALLVVDVRGFSGRLFSLSLFVVLQAAYTSLPEGIDLIPLTLQ